MTQVILLVILFLLLYIIVKLRTINEKLDCIDTGKPQEAERIIVKLDLDKN